MKQPNNTKYSVALYMRLSRDDENYGDSVSIETQRTILRQYANDHNLYVIDEYVDDGWSGTNFERPSFKRMMEDVDLGRVIHHNVFSAKTAEVFSYDTVYSP